MSDVAGVRRKLLQLLLLLCVSTLGVARVLQDRRTSDDGSSGTLGPWHRDGAQPAVRQLDVSPTDTGGTMTSSCEWLCELGTCGTACGLITRSAPADFPGRLMTPYRPSHNTSDVAHRGAIGKRAFDWDKRWSAANADKYMVDAFFNPDSQFRVVQWLIADGNMATVSRAGRFTEGLAFQIGSAGLHGCTVMTLVSNRAVYMAHYWEVYALGGDDDVSTTAPKYNDFRIKVLNAITGEGEQDPITVGTGIDWDDYNQPGDKARLFFMSPAIEGWTPAQGYKLEYLMYRNKVSAMAELVQQHIPGVQVRIVPYRRLNYRYNGGDPTGPDAAIVNTNARGMAFFQHDGTFEGGYWRLMYEYTRYQQGDTK